MLKAITFDFWDTLYRVPRNEGVFKRRVASFQQVLQETGHTVDLDSIREAFWDCWQYANHYQIECGLELTPNGHVEFILRQLHIDLGMADWKKVYEVYIMISPDYKPPLNEGVRETLPVLAEQYKLAVICNTGVSPGKLLRELMQADDILKYFTLTVFSDEVRWAKPNIKIFNYTLEQLQVPAAEAAHVGDNSITDMDGARKAGMTTIWLAPEEDEISALHDYQIRSIRELLDLF